MVRSASILQATRMTSSATQDLRRGEARKSARSGSPPRRTDLARLVHSPPRAVYRRLEKGELHFAKTGSGELFICCTSLQPG